MDNSRPIGPVGRIYRKKTSQKIGGFGFLAFGVASLIMIWGGAISGNRFATLGEMFLPIFPLIVGCLFTASAFKSFVRFSETAIELQTLVDKKALPFDKIRGRRRYLDRGGEESPSVWHLKLEPNDDLFPVLDFEESYYTFDYSFRQWFNALPDLDAADKNHKKTSNFGLV